jgi:hypothetical protein
VDKDEALKLALEALQWNWGGEPLPTLELKAINAIKEALAQPEQEPVAWAGFNERGECREIVTRDVRKTIPYYPTEGMTPLYAIPPRREWVGLTEEEYKNIRYGSDESGELYVSYTSYDEGDGYEEIEIYVDDFAKAIEAKLREKNT